MAQLGLVIAPLRLPSTELSRLAVQAAVNQVWRLGLGESDRRQWAGPMSCLNMSARWSKIPRCPSPWRMASRAVGMCSCSQ